MPFCRGLQDELFNLTLDQLRVKAERTRAEASLNGTIQRIQLDNQMLVRPEAAMLRHYLECLTNVTGRNGAFLCGLARPSYLSKQQEQTVP